VIVNLTRFVLLLRRVGRRICFLKKTIVQDETIRPPGGALAWPASLIASPGAGEESQRAELIALGSALLRTNVSD
jgi:hypothetical protein